MTLLSEWTELVDILGLHLNHSDRSTGFRASWVGKWTLGVTRNIVTNSPILKITTLHGVYSICAVCVCIMCYSHLKTDLKMILGMGEGITAGDYERISISLLYIPARTRQEDKDSLNPDILYLLKLVILIRRTFLSAWFSIYRSTKRTCRRRFIIIMKVFSRKIWKYPSKLNCFCLNNASAMKQV